MAEIIHRVGIKASPDKVFRALSTIEGLAGWWTSGIGRNHCSTKWAIFLMSLKELIETGKGKSAPRDIKIDNWN